MNRLLPWIVVMLTALWVAMAWRVPTAPQNDFDTREFGRLPVLVGGRVKHRRKSTPARAESSPTAWAAS